MKWYKDKPEEGDFVVVTLTDVEQNSAYAKLEAYPELEGLIHISEVSRSWIQDIRKELDEGEKTVAQVIEKDDETITLSIKRVNQKNKRETLEKWNKERKAEKYIEDLAEILEMDKEEVYEDIIFKLQDKYQSSFKVFEISETEEDELKELLDEKTVKAIQEVANKNMDLRQEKLEGKIEMSFAQGNGVERLRKALDLDDTGVEVKYVSAPEYKITAWGRTMEIAKNRIDNTVKTIRSKVDELDGEFHFERA